MSYAEIKQKIFDRNTSISTDLRCKKEKSTRSVSAEMLRLFHSEPLSLASDMNSPDRRNNDEWMWKLISGDDDCTMLLGCHLRTL